MQVEKTIMRARGKTIKVNSMQIDNNKVIFEGKHIKIAKIREEWLEDVNNPESIISALKKVNFKVDIFTFWQRLPESTPKFNYFMEWDNVAAIPIISFDHWWEKQIRGEVRTKVRKAEKKGVVVKAVNFNDKLVEGVKKIYNETPIRQGKPFWHYGNDFDTVKKKLSTFSDRSDFIGAYYNDEMIGFAKLIFAGKFTTMMHIISMIKHRDKSPTNALIAKAVDICDKKKSPYLEYGKFVYRRSGNRTLTDFKRKNGFEKIDLPRYYIPLTTKGKMILKLKLHHGIKEMLPEKLIVRLIDLRAKWYARRH